MVGKREKSRQKNDDTRKEKKGAKKVSTMTKHKTNKEKKK